MSNAQISGHMYGPPAPHIAFWYGEHYLGEVRGHPAEDIGIAQAKLQRQLEMLQYGDWASNERGKLLRLGKYDRAMLYCGRFSMNVGEWNNREREAAGDSIAHARARRQEKESLTDKANDFFDEIQCLDLPVTPENLQRVKLVALAGWRRRAAEREFTEPADLSSSCKFSTLLVMLVFGGVIRGNEHHQFNVINGKTVDINADAADVCALKSRGIDVHAHDPYFFGNEEHLESMRSCVPRAKSWAYDYLHQT